MADDLHKLKKDIASNQVLIFVGSDVSMYTAYGAEKISFWNKILKSGLNQCYHMNKIDAKDFDASIKQLSSNFIDVDNHILITDHIKYWLTEEINVYESWLTNTIRQLHIQNPGLIETIKGLQCPIFTTNYDLFLENVLNKKALTWNNYLTESDSLIDTNDYILHIYGHYKTPGSMIFNSADHRQLHHDEFVRSKFQSLIRGKTLLFIGYGTSIVDPSFSHLCKWIFDISSDHSPTIYKLVQANIRHAVFESIKEIYYGNTYEDLLFFIQSLSSFSILFRENLSFTNRKRNVREKYLNYLIDEYGHVSMFGYTDNDLSLPLESVYVELKFDPTHPSTKAMKTVEINEEFKRKVSSHGFFSATEKGKLIQAIAKRNDYNPETIYRDLMIDQWLNVLLTNREIFSADEATTIRSKISNLKEVILEKNHLKEARQYQIREAYNEFKHFIILGHPGSGKTTISKWLVMNMAQQCLGKKNTLFDQIDISRAKLPILIPIWKYVDQVKENCKKQKTTLLQFLYENATLNSAAFTKEERNDLSALIIEMLIRGNVLIIFEGLDEVPAHVDRTDLMKDINTLLERPIDYDPRSGKLTHSLYEQKEINNTKDPTIGNRILITSRIEGNYFEDINFYIPRFTIQDMSNEALKLFCNSYTKCIRGSLIDEAKADQLYHEITQNKDIFQLAINPQLASVIAAVYNQYEDKLPEKRIDLYEKAIEKMIDRLVTSSLNEDHQLNAIMLWSILQTIAEYLHSKVEGLSENNLRTIIHRCLLDLNEQHIDDFTSNLVDVFKYKVGLLNEFGYDSFRFIHRTFQEYLAAKSLLYRNGSVRSEDSIYENIRNKIDIPNWRVPLNMTFGILSKYHQHNGLFTGIFKRLLANEQASGYSTLIVPFVIIDSLNDMYFASNDVEYELIRKLIHMLLCDYKNQSGFSRLKDHQNFLHSYFFKLKDKYEDVIEFWFIEMLTNEENIAPCASIVLRLQWYSSQFHEIFLQNLHHDSDIWNWPIDSILRWYSTEIKRLPMKQTLTDNLPLVEHIQRIADWLGLMIALYGGHENFDIQASICECFETAQFLALSDTQRAPFIFYYENKWGKDDPAYQMAVHLDTFLAKKNWTNIPRFNHEKIYKESFLTSRIMKLLNERRPTSDLIEELKELIDTTDLCLTSKIDVLIALVALGVFDFANVVTTNADEILLKSFTKRLEQSISVLKDPVARWSSCVEKYLLTIYNNFESNPAQCSPNFSAYCKIYLSLIISSGGFPVDTSTLAATINGIGNKSDLYGEYFCQQLTSGSEGDVLHGIRTVSNILQKTMKSDLLMQSFLKTNEAIQIYRPVRGYAWPTDRFAFQSFAENDIPIAFFNCLENLHTNLACLIESIYEKFLEEGYFDRNPDLIPLFTLLIFGIMSKDLNKTKIYEKLLPEMFDTKNVKQLLLEKIQTICNPYYKARALYQLAQVYDIESFALLNESFNLTNKISDACQKFQVLEKIYNVLHYKEVNRNEFSERVVSELILTCDCITNLRDRIIALIRLSFYQSGPMRKQNFISALEILNQMDENDEKLQLIIKLKPLVALYDDLHVRLDRIVDCLENNISKDLVNSFYGRILSLEQFKSSSEYTEMQTLFRLVARLNDAKLMLNKGNTSDQLWLRLYKDVNDQSIIAKVLEIGVEKELFLTPQIAIIIDELIERGEEEKISILFPYIIKPSNEVLPIVHRWFTKHPKQKINELAVLLLAEHQHIFESAIDTTTHLLENENDQIRYRTERLFQHPDRNPSVPSRNASVIGEKTLIKLIQVIPTKEHIPPVRAFLSSFFFDLLWDDYHIFQYLHENFRKSENQQTVFANRVQFVTIDCWNTIIESAESSQDSLYIENILNLTLDLVVNHQVLADDWARFADILSMTDTSQFRDQRYFSSNERAVINLMINEICVSTNLDDDTYFINLESKIVNELTVTVDELARSRFNQVEEIGRCTFRVSTRNINEIVLGMLSDIPITTSMMDNLLQWLLQKISDFQGFNDSIYSLMIEESLLALVSVCVQKEDYLYRKVTNSPKFNKILLIQLLQKMIHHHPYFLARGSAFVLLAALDLTDHKVIINSLNVLFDENLVKDYSTIGIPLIHLSPNDFIDDLLKILTNESAIKIYELLKIITQFALDEKIDADCKSKIIDYVVREIGQVQAKKPVNYYYTEIRIPFTATLENELYKTWIKIQGFSGKTQYAVTINN
ncbi:unnamed protein product [Adineta ricciae]|uniref:Nephrocystin 3-like N-terminal domain-containing protein n=1 Tax=Adineta ricciae TaxID=249248 RepID=A0A815W0T6_ADIRI|nr:unnamed protein product [Adineta ricciae]CAF1534888.1 unnamed protein product [Adineta ricciae]